MDKTTGDGNEDHSEDSSRGIIDEARARPEFISDRSENFMTGEEEEPEQPEAPVVRGIIHEALRLALNGVRLLGDIPIEGGSLQQEYPEMSLEEERSRIGYGTDMGRTFTFSDRVFGERTEMPTEVGILELFGRLINNAPIVEETSQQGGAEISLEERRRVMIDENGIEIKVRIENEMQEAEAKNEAEMDRNCCICFDTEIPGRPMNCTHHFHTECIVKTLVYDVITGRQPRCPSCRKDLSYLIPRT